MTKLPCKLCALSSRIMIEDSDKQDTHGIYCHRFCIRIPVESVSDPDSEIRKNCLQSGDYFYWKTAGVSVKEALELSDRAMMRKGQRFLERHTVLVSTLSLFVAGLALLISFYP